MKILNAIIEKLTPRGLLIILVVLAIAVLAVFLYRDISVDEGGLTVNKGESIETIDDGNDAGSDDSAAPSVWNTPNP